MYLKAGSPYSLISLRFLLSGQARRFFREEQPHFPSFAHVSHSALLFLTKRETQTAPLPPVKTLLVLVMLSTFPHFSSVKAHYYLFVTLIRQIVIMETAIAGGKIKPGEKGLLLFKYQFIFFLVDYCFSDTSETHLLRFRPS